MLRHLRRPASFFAVNENILVPLTVDEFRAIEQRERNSRQFSQVSQLAKVMNRKRH